VEDNIYTAVAFAWANQGTQRAAENAEKLIQQAQSSKPSLVHWNVVIKAWAEIGTVESAKRVEELRTKMVSMFGEDASRDDFGLLTLLNAWANVGTFESAKMTEKLLHDLPPHASNSVAWNTLVKAWAKVGTVAAAQKAEQTLMKMVENGLANTRSWNTVIRCYADLKTEASASKADDLLKLMIPTGLADVISWNSVILGWSNVGSMHSAEQALHVFERLYDAGLATDPKSWDYILEAFEKVGTKEAAIRAEECLYLMISNKTMLDWIRPYPFDVAIRTWAGLNTLEGAKKAESLLEEKCAAGLSSSSSQAWDAVMKAYAKLRTPESTEKAAQLLYRAIAADVELDTWTWNVVINAFATKGTQESVAKAEKLCKEMIKHLNFMKVSDGGIDIAGMRLSHAEKEGVVLNYNTVMKAYAVLMQELNQRNKAIANRQPRQGENKKWKSSQAPSSQRADAPPVPTETLVKLAERVEVILNDLVALQLSPDIISWNTCINAWASVGNEFGAQNADRVFQNFAQQSEASDSTTSSSSSPTSSTSSATASLVVPPFLTSSFSSSSKPARPNTISYSTVLKAWANVRKSHNAALKAEQVLDAMIKAGFKTDAIVWTTLMKAWADVGGVEGIEKAEKIMTRMKEHGIEPNIFAFNILSQAYSLHGMSVKHFALLDSLPKYIASNNGKIDKYVMPPFFYAVKAMQVPRDRAQHLEKVLVFMGRNNIDMTDYMYDLARRIPEFKSKRFQPLEKWGIAMCQL
jgi:hypothetical protein